jgi:tetratricopeptide (TPR) repeat protein
MSEYEGGGTWFEGLNGNPEGGVIEMDEGQVTVRPGGVKHCGHAVHSGTRYIIGGFCMHKQKVEKVRQLLHSPPETPASTLQKTCEAAVALNPSIDLGYNLLANVYEKAGEVKKAKEVLEYCLEKVHPFSGDIAYALASIYKDENEYEKARNCFLTCLKCDKYDFDAMIAIVSMSAALGDRALEEEYCKRIVNLGGASADVAGQAYCNLGVLFEGKDEEIGFFQKSMELKPTAFAPSYSLGCAFAARKQWSSAVDAFKKSIPLSTTEDDKLMALKNLYRSACSLVQSDPSSGSTSQHDLLERLGSTMGKENFQLLREMMKQ